MPILRAPCLVAVAVAALLVPVARAADAVVEVRAKAKPDKEWKTYPTRTVDALPGFRPAAAPATLDAYGGWVGGEKHAATGFFYPKRIADRWWLITPEGNRFLHVAVDTVSPARTPTAAPVFKEKFNGDTAVWAAASAKLLHDHGFNGTGAWSNTAELAAPAHRLSYTVILNLMSTFGRSKGLTTQKPGHAGYPGDCFPVFHPEFPAWCDEQCKKLAKNKPDPWLLGYFSDNELPPPSLDKYLKLDPADPHMGSSRAAADAWLAARGKPGGKGVTDDDRDEFLGYVFGKYFEITTRAIRAHDPNHLCLGSRYHSSEKRKMPAWREAGKHLDVVAVNVYGVWTPDVEQSRNWAAWAGKPFVVTEFYTKAADSGFPNTTGAGWIVPTQRDRGLAYQNFCLALLESRACVGWHFFKYQDNDMADTKAEPSNRDSNKGIVDIRYAPYTDLLGPMKALNDQVYPLTAYFDRAK